jgi:hypothetical protein
LGEVGLGIFWGRLLFGLFFSAFYHLPHFRQRLPGWVTFFFFSACYRDLVKKSAHSFFGLLRIVFSVVMGKTDYTFYMRFICCQNYLIFILPHRPYNAALSSEHGPKAEGGSPAAGGELARRSRKRAACQPRTD